MDINNPVTLAEFTAVFYTYEQALTGNDVQKLDELFWKSADTVRYGAKENLYGIEMIRAFRSARPGSNLQREIVMQSIKTFGDAFAVANIEFRRAGESRVGRQSQSWVRFPEGWQVVAAHVSWMDL